MMRFERKPYRVLTDRQVEDACKLRGVPFRDLHRVKCVIRDAFGGRLVRYYTRRSTLGSVYGRWTVEDIDSGETLHDWHN